MIAARQSPTAPFAMSPEAASMRRSWRGYPATGARVVDMRWHGVRSSEAIEKSRACWQLGIAEHGTSHHEAES
jgi:hypothetical protein